jgi:formylglycine-generating enzyme required for sulfatase activity
MSAAAVLAAVLAAAALPTSDRAAASGLARAPGTSFRDCPDCPEMVVAPPGSFSMGAPDGSYGPNIDTGYVHRVTISAPFALGRYAVTRGEYAVFVRETQRPDPDDCYVWSTRINNWTDGPGRSWRHPGFVQSDRDPVVCVSSDDAKDYIRWLNRKVAGADDGPYRLPLDEEWEYAARAGTTSKYYWGEEASRRMANFGSVGTHPYRPAAIGPDRWLHTSPVGSFPPNAFGLYDMAGNVTELTGSCMNDAYPPDKHSGKCKTGFLTNNDDAVFTRGGSWLDPPPYVGVAARAWVEQGARTTVVGFRVLRSLD